MKNASKKNTNANANKSKKKKQNKKLKKKNEKKKNKNLNYGLAKSTLKKKVSWPKTMNKQFKNLLII